MASQSVTIQHQSSSRRSRCVVVRDSIADRVGHANTVGELPVAMYTTDRDSHFV